MLHRADDADAADDLVVDRARGPASRRRRDRLASRRGRHPPHHVPRGPPPVPPVGQRAGRKRHPDGRAGGDDRVERLPAPGALLRGVGSRQRPAHDQPAPASRADRLDRQPRRGQRAVLRPDVPAAGRGGRAPLQDRAPLGPDDRPRPHAGRDQDPQPGVLRGTGRQPFRQVHVAGVRREHGVVHVLHVRHHRQSQGRAVQPPLDRAAHAGGGAAGCAQCVGARCHPAGGADVPRQRMGTAVRRRDGGLQDGVPGPATWTASRSTSCSRPRR